MNTIYDIAQAAGVSASTVTRVHFSGQGSKKNQELVFRVAKQMNFAINDSAKILKTKKTNRVMLAVPGSILQPLLLQDDRGRQRGLRAERLSVHAVLHQHSLAGNSKALKLLNQKVVDGMIMVSFHFSRTTSTPSGNQTTRSC